jgi:hypothetical protein
VAHGPKGDQLHMRTQTIVGLAHQCILAEGLLLAKAPTAMRPDELADGQRKAVDDGKRGVMRNLGQHPC